MRLKKYLWFGLIPLAFWLIAIFHKLTGLSIMLGYWYSYPLFMTYAIVIILSVVTAVHKGLD